MFLTFATCTDRTLTSDQHVQYYSVETEALIFSSKSSLLAQIQPQLAVSPPVISQARGNISAVLQEKGVLSMI